MKRLVFLPFAVLVVAACQDTTQPNESPLPTPLLSTSGYVVGPETRITTDPRDDGYAQISGDRIVWNAIEAGIHDIYLGEWNGESWVETRLTDNAVTQSTPRISGDRIVWWETDAGIYNVCLAEWDGGIWDETQFTNDPAMQLSPDISGNRITWLDYRNGSGEIYVAEWDGTSWNESLLSPNTVSPGEPAIDGDRIVWRDRRDGNFEIYVAEWTGAAWVETRITEDAATQIHPDISGSWIVWYNQYEDGDRDVYAAEWTEGGWVENPIATGAADQVNPAISNDWIVWVERQDPTDNHDVYLYDLVNSTEVQITNSSADHYWPTVWGNRIVWSEIREGNKDVYMVEVSAAMPPSVEEIIDQVDQCVADGGISNKGIGEALHAFLRQVATDVAKDDYAAACARLARFLDFVAKKADKQIGAACAELLTDQANALGASYGCSW